MGKKKPIILSAAAVVAGITPTLAQTSTPVEGKIQNPSFENETGGWTNNGFTSLHQNDKALVPLAGNYYAALTEKKNASFSQEITLDKGYYELTAVGSLKDKTKGTDGLKGFFLFAGSNEVEFGNEGTYCVPFVMETQGDITIGAKTVSPEGDWARIDNFQLVKYDISLAEYKKKLTTDLAISINKAAKYTEDPTLQGLAVDASNLQIRVNDLKMFYGTEEARKTLEADIETLGKAVKKAAENYEAYTAAKEKYNDTLLGLKADLDAVWNGLKKEAQDAARETYENNLKLIDGFISEAEEAYKNGNAGSLFTDEEIKKKVESIKKSVTDAEEALTTGGNNALSHANVVAKIEESRTAYNTYAKQLYTNLVDPNEKTDGAIYTDWYTAGLKELNDALRVINEVEEQNEAKYKEKKCDKVSQTEFEKKLTEATGKLAEIVEDYTDKAANWRLWYKRANKEIADLQGTYDKNINNPIKNLTGIKDVAAPAKSAVETAFQKTRDDIDSKFKAIKDKVEAANKAHTITDKYYDGFQNEYDAIQNFIKEGSDLQKWVANAVTQFDAIKSAYSNIDNSQSKFKTANKSVNETKAADKTYTQTGKFSKKEKEITDSLSKLETDRGKKWDEIVNDKFKKTNLGPDFLSSVETKVNEIDSKISEYTKTANDVLAKYNEIYNAIKGYKEAVKTLNATAKNQDVTIGGDLDKATYADTIAGFNKKIINLENSFKAAVGKNNDEYVKAMNALKTIEGLTGEITALKDAYAEAEEKWTANQLTAAKGRLIAEAQRRIDLLDTSFPVKNEYESREATNTTTGRPTDSFEDATYGKSAGTLNDELNVIKGTKQTLQTKLDAAAAESEPAEEAIPVLSTINDEVKAAQKDYTALCNKADSIKDVFLGEKLANEELRKLVKTNVTDYIEGNEEIKGLGALLPEKNPNKKATFTKEKSDITTEKDAILGDIAKSFEAETLVKDREDVKDGEGKVTKEGFNTRISKAETKINNLRTLAINEQKNTTASEEWDIAVKDAKFDEKATEVSTKIGNTATGDALTYFEKELSTITDNYEKLAVKTDCKATKAKTAVAKSTLSGAQKDQAIYTDTKNNMAAKLEGFKKELKGYVDKLQDLPGRAEANEKAKKEFDAAYTKAKATRDSLFTVITNAETSSYTDSAMTEVLAIDEKLKAFDGKLNTDFGKGACGTEKENLDGLMTEINSRLKVLGDGWNDKYKEAVARDNADRYVTFNSAYATLTRTYSEQVDLFTKLSKLSYAQGLTGEYETATNGEEGIYNIANKIRELKNTVDATYLATDAPTLWDATESYLTSAMELSKTIESRVGTYATAVNGQAESTWTNAKKSAEENIDNAKRDLTSTLGYDEAAAKKDLKDIQEIIDKATQGYGENDFAYILDTEILPALATIDSKIEACKDAAAIKQFDKKMKAMQDTIAVEGPAIAEFLNKDGVKGAYSKDYQKEVIDTLQYTLNFWKDVEEGQEFEQYAAALAKGYNGIKISDEDGYKGHTVIYATACKEDKAFRANDKAYEDAKELMKGIQSKADTVEKFAMSLFAKYNSGVVGALEDMSEEISKYNKEIEDNHKEGNSETYLTTIKKGKEDLEKNVEAVKATAIEAERTELNAEIPALRHDYELATAALIGQPEEVQAQLDGYQETIEGYLNKIGRIYKDYNEGKIGTDGKQLKDNKGKAIKATAEETRLAYIALEKEMAKTKVELTSYYNQEVLNNAVKEAQDSIDVLNKKYQAISEQLADCHEPVVKMYEEEAKAFKGAIDALQTELDGYKAEQSLLFYKNNMATSTANVATEYASLSEDIAKEEKPYDQFDADKATVTEIHKGLTDKLNAVYAKTQAYEHKVAISDVDKDKEEYKDCDDYADYVFNSLKKEIEAQEKALAKEEAPKTIDVTSYKKAADGIEKKEGQYGGFYSATESIENMDGYFAYRENLGFYNDVLAILRSVETEMSNYSHLTSTVNDVRQLKDAISTQNSTIYSYGSNLKNNGYSDKDIDGNAYTKDTKGAKKDADGKWTLEEDYVKVSPEIQSRLKALLDQAKALLEYAEANRAIRGDINGDSKVTVDDYTDLAQHISNDNVADYTEREAWAADANEDGELDVSDLQKIVLIATDNFSKVKQRHAAAFLAKEASANDQLTVEVNGNVLSLGITNAVAYIGFQMDVTLPAGASISEEALTERANGQELAVANIGNNTYRILVMGTESAAFNGNAGAIVNLKLDNLYGKVAVSNAVFTDAKANSYKFELENTPTAINGVEAQQSVTEKIYSVGGQMRNAIGKGVNIIKNNGVVKKLMNK